MIMCLNLQITFFLSPQGGPLTPTIEDDNQLMTPEMHRNIKEMKF